MDWDDWIATWALHAESQAFKRRLGLAIEYAQRGATVGNMFCALSGGKDGCALAAVLVEGGMADMPMVHCHTDLNTPGMEECAYATADRFDLELEVIEPDVDVWALLCSLPSGEPVWGEANHSTLMRHIASGNMLVAHLYEHQYRGNFSGMRAEESRARRLNRKFRGPLYQLRDDTWMCQPIVDWMARDVFAMLVSREAPIHPHYRLMLERFQVEPESPSCRVDCMIPDERVTSWPVGYQVRMLYPDLWRRMVAARPELRLQGG